jgi:hypothetical protein
MLNLLLDICELLYPAHHLVIPFRNDPSFIQEDDSVGKVRELDGVSYHHHSFVLELVSD